MALSAERNTKQSLPGKLGRPLAAVKVWKGSLCMLSAGYATPGAAGTGKVCIGRSRKTLDNSGGSAGDLVGEFDEGEFWWANGSSIVRADVGSIAYISDDLTVTTTSSGKSPAGIIRDVSTADGVLVESRESLSRALLLGLAAEPASSIQSGHGSLSSGVLTVATGIVTTASSQVFAQVITPGGTLGTYGLKAAVTVVGAAGTGAIVITSINDNAGTDSSDTSDVAWLIVG